MEVKGQQVSGWVLPTASTQVRSEGRGQRARPLPALWAQVGRPPCDAVGRRRPAFCSLLTLPLRPRRLSLNFKGTQGGWCPLGGEQRSESRQHEDPGQVQGNGQGPTGGHVPVAPELVPGLRVRQALPTPRALEGSQGSGHRGPGFWTPHSQHVTHGAGRTAEQPGPTAAATTGA